MIFSDCFLTKLVVYLLVNRKYIFDTCKIQIYGTGKRIKDLFKQGGIIRDYRKVEGTGGLFGKFF